ncbi:MAG: HAMP domain-containing histidine kinase, partial [Acidobacteriota bacterium]|nr:HAMP domain-containing histidine kinase [Acidobacteriota bacterium]
AILCGILALLQNRWIAEVSLAEKERLQQHLQANLNLLSREFNSELTAACSGLLPATPQIEKLGRENAYSGRYSQWKETHDHIFSRIALAVPHMPPDGGLTFLDLNLDTAQFSQAEWPAAWTGMRDHIISRLDGGPFEPTGPRNSTLIEIPRFGRPEDRREPGPGPGPRVQEQEWLIVEVNLNYIRTAMIPDLLHRYLGEGGKLAYQAEVVDNFSPEKVIFRSTPDQTDAMFRTPDASVNLFEIDRGPMIRRGGDRGPWRFRGPPPGADGGRGQWRLLVRHQAGSLEAVVSRARWQNLATSLGLLLLILATVAALVRFSRRAQQLAEQQMNFVAGVSHELRTPITVIRTAAFNLRGRLATRPEQVERYGKLIQDESAKLTALVDQVLRFASGRAGHLIQERKPVAVDAMIDSGLRSSRSRLAASDLIVEKKLDPDLPLILADELAMNHVLQNLFDNALKYGTEGSNWIGVFASAVSGEDGAAVELRVADHGPGIPLEEQEHIFDPFFRGRRAVQDQIHGTGLGLNLVKKIVEAHGGTIRVESEPMKGTAFIVRIPAASPELQDEFANFTG